MTTWLRTTSLGCGWVNKSAINIYGPFRNKVNNSTTVFMHMYDDFIDRVLKSSFSEDSHTVVHLMLTPKSADL